MSTHEEAAAQALDTTATHYALHIMTGSTEDTGMWMRGSGDFVGVRVDRDKKQFLELDDTAKISVDWAEVQRQHARYVADPVGSGVHAAICALLWSARMSRDSAQ